MTFKKTLFPAIALAGLLAGGADADVILTSDGFEGSSGNWTFDNGAALYTYASGTNFATTGNGAYDGTDGNATLTTALALDSLGASDITIAFDVKWDGGSSTNRSFIEVSFDGGSNWLNIGNIQNATPYYGDGGGAYAASITLTEGSGQTQSSTIRTAASTPYNGVASFTDNMVFRFRDSSGSSHHPYIDNVVISSATATPEPGSLALLGLGGLCVLRRRRNG